MNWKKFLLEQDIDSYIALGLINGAAVENKFGFNADIDTASVPESLWENDGLYPWQSSVFSAEAVSSSTDDDVGGTGATELQCWGLDANYALQSCTCFLDGTTPVTIPETWRRIFRARITLAGSGETNAGLITIRLASAGATQAVITAGVGSTRLGIYTIPVGKTGLFREMTVGVLKSPATSDANVGLYTRFNDIAGRPWVERWVMAMPTTGTSTAKHRFQTSLVMPEKTDIELRVLSVASNDSGVFGTFELLILDD